MLEGEIAQINLVARLVELWREKFTGAIRFENDGVIKIVYFKSGDVLSASTNDRNDSVDEILMRAGKVSKEHVKQALAKRKESETLGDALLNLGFITRKELAWGRRIQIINVIRSIDEWNAGSFTIVADYLPKRDEGTLYPLPQVLVEMIVTDQDRQKFERALDSGSRVFEKAPGHEALFTRLGLNEDAEAIMAQVDGTRSASEVANASRQETFNAFKLMQALFVLGILQKKSSATAMPSGFESAGVADASDAWGSPAAMPSFDLDDEPLPASISMQAVEPAALSIPAYEIPPADPIMEPQPEIGMPAWALEPAETLVTTPAPKPVKPTEEPGWGFDLAQVETARKTHAEPAKSPADSDLGSSPTMRRRPAVPVKTREPRRFGLLVALMVIFILAAGSYYGWTWWNGRGATPPVAPVAANVTTMASQTATAEPGVPATSTIVELTATQPAQPPQPTATATTSTTDNQQPTGTPRQTPPIATTPAASGSELRERYDTMAREFAANPTGNFTVQFAIVCDPVNVTKALQSGVADRVWFIPISLKGRACYRMFWGGFPTRADADRSMAQLPAALRESNPAVVMVPR